MILFALAIAMDGPQATAIGQETSIPWAANGGLRDWQAGPPDSNVLYVRDRTERWYQVKLTGPCATDASFDTLVYTTDVNGTFDTFSNVSIARYPDRVCGVTSIRTSAPPPGRPGAKK